MSDDLIERLRSYRSFDEFGDVQHAVCDEAADELARLRAALSDERAHADALAEALTASTDELISYAHSEYDGVWSDEDFDMIEAPYQAKLFQHRARRQG